jgi:hypothetical protein
MEQPGKAIPGQVCFAKKPDVTVDPYWQNSRAGTTKSRFLL